MSEIDHSELKHSPLHDEHESLGARMASFAGWSMPIQFAGVMPEHRAVRESLGVFDISHMGQLWVEGRGEEGAAVVTAWLNHVLCNDVAALEPGQGQYTLMLNTEGGVIDDLLIYRVTERRFFLVVNAARIAEDVAHLQSLMVENVSLEDVSEITGAIAVQGPDSAVAFAAMARAAGLESAELPPRNGFAAFGEGEAAFELCRTGYTGEDGFELFCPAAATALWWRRAIDAGATPCGLGARDTLRLEKCYPLNGSDLDEAHTPIEAGLGFFVALDKGDFVGREVLAEQKENGPKRRLAALRIIDKGPPPRPSYEVFVTDAEQPVGVLSSGSLSPTLGAGIAMAYLPADLAKPGQRVAVDVRGRRFAAEVVKKPFVKGSP